MKENLFLNRASILSNVLFIAIFTNIIFNLTYYFYFIIYDVNLVFFKFNIKIKF